MDEIVIGDLTADDGLDGDICLEIAIDACDRDAARTYLSPEQCRTLIHWMQKFLSSGNTSQTE